MTSSPSNHFLCPAMYTCTPHRPFISKPIRTWDDDWDIDNDRELVERECRHVRDRSHSIMEATELWDECEENCEWE